MRPYVLSIPSLRHLLPALLLLGGCSGESQAPAATNGEGGAGLTPSNRPAAIEKGMYFKPDLAAFALHNEYDADGDGDGSEETHVQRFINSKGDTAFSMTTGDRLWAWSLDVRNDDTDIRSNYVIRDSNCDGVFDERYSLEAEFHLPDCVTREEVVTTPKET